MHIITLQLDSTNLIAPPIMKWLLALKWASYFCPAARPHVHRCPTIGDLVTKDMCSCPCVVEPPPTPTAITDPTTPPLPTLMVTGALSTTGATPTIGVIPTTGATPTTAASTTIRSRRAAKGPMGMMPMPMPMMMTCPTCNATCSRLSSGELTIVLQCFQCNGNGWTIYTGNKLLFLSLCCVKINCLHDLQVTDNIQ